MKEYELTDKEKSSFSTMSAKQATREPVYDQWVCRDCNYEFSSDDAERYDRDKDHPACISCGSSETEPVGGW